NGCAIAFAGSILFINAAEFALARRRLKLQWWNAKYAKWPFPIVVAAATCVVVRTQMPASDVLLQLVIGFFLVHIAFHVASWAQGLDHEDRALVAHVLARVRRLAGI